MSPDRTREAGVKPAWAGNERAVSEVLGFVFVFALVMSMVALVSVAGFDMVTETRNAEQLNNAERAFDILAENVAQMHREGAPSRATEISLANARLSTGDPIWINVSADPTDARTNPAARSEHEIDPIVYEGEEGSRLVYAAGGVYRMPEEGSYTVREAPFLLSEDGATVSVVAMNASEQPVVGGSTTLVRTKRTDRSVEFGDTTGTYTDVWINVTTTDRRRGLWEDALDSPITTCQTPASDTVACQLTTVPDQLYVTSLELRVEFEQ